MGSSLDLAAIVLGFTFAMSAAMALAAILMERGWPKRGEPGRRAVLCLAILLPVFVLLFAYGLSHLPPGA